MKRKGIDIENQISKTRAIPKPVSQCENLECGLVFSVEMLSDMEAYQTLVFKCLRFLCTSKSIAEELWTMNSSWRHSGLKNMLAWVQQCLLPHLIFNKESSIIVQKSSLRTDHMFSLWKVEEDISKKDCNSYSKGRNMSI